MTSSTEKLRRQIYLIIFIAVMLRGTFGFMSAEGMSLIDAVYFTIATVGYGDISPVTTLGKFLDVILIVTGVIASATDLFLSRRKNRTRRQKLNMVIGLYFSETGASLLIATLHLKEELVHREDFLHLLETGRKHLTGDINRIYGLLARQWVDYMRHLKHHPGHADQPVRPAGISGRALGGTL